METMSHLAIASVPVQQWKEVYDEEQAFSNGTIFPELDKPFFVTVQDSKLEKGPKRFVNKLNAEDTALLQIQQTSFAVDDLKLYMDTHPEDQEGLQLLKEMLKRRKTLLKEFALQYYPLTVDCMYDIYEENPESTCYCWPEGKIPWERSV